MKAYNIIPKEVQLSDFTLSCIPLGERGRGRKQVLVACPAEFKYLEPRLTEKGRFRLTASESDKGWVARISTGGAYIRNANGNISAPKEYANSITVGALGYGAFGDAGRVGSWDDLVLTTDMDEFWVRVKPSRGDAYILMFNKEGKVSQVSYEEADLLDLDLQGSTPSSRGEQLVRLGL